MSKTKKTKTEKKPSPIEQTSAVAVFIIVIVFLAITLSIHFFVPQFSWYWFSFALIALLAFLLPVYLKIFIASKHNLPPKQVQKLNMTISKNIIFYWYCDLFYMSIFINSKVCQYIFGGIILFWTLINACAFFLADNIQISKAWLLCDLIIGLALIVYLIILIENPMVQGIVTPIVAAVLGGMLTLVGVAWTIKKAEKDKKELAIKEAKPLFSFEMILNDVEKISCSKVCIDSLLDKQKYQFPVAFILENSPKASFTIEKVYHDGNWACLEGNKVVLPSAKVQVNFVLNNFDNIYLEVTDSLDNKYYYAIKVNVIPNDLSQFTVAGITEISIDDLRKNGVEV